MAAERATIRPSRSRPFRRLAYQPAKPRTIIGAPPYEKSGKSRSALSQ
ncbi:hypothetical protein ACWDRB_21000 [Nonomuraea sp. NPDC003707]